jgi:hypothetical protein
MAGADGSGQSHVTAKMLKALTPTLSRNTGRGGKSLDAIALGRVGWPMKLADMGGL